MAWLARALARGDRNNKLVSVVNLRGMLAPPARGPRKLLNEERAKPWLDKAFLLKPDAVAISVSSPGGSPAATEALVAAIRERAEASSGNIPVWGFATDVAASGGMWLLAGASDECYALETSVVGSIGVVAPSFGAVDALTKLGLERRVLKAGSAKAGADPFTPLSEEEKERIQSILDDLHSTFISAIKRRRGPQIERAAQRLKERVGKDGGDDDDEESKKLQALLPDIFSGRVFTGKQAASLGLIDGVGGLREVCRRRLGSGVRFAECGERAATGSGIFGGGARSSLSSLLLPSSLSALPADAVDRVMDALEERGAYARFGVL